MANQEKAGKVDKKSTKKSKVKVKPLSHEELLAQLKAEDKDGVLLRAHYRLCPVCSASLTLWEQ